MRKYFFVLFSFILITNLQAFDWPISDINENSFTSSFGQNRGGLISTSLCFSEPSEIKATEKGTILTVIKEIEDDSDFFPSTLGNCVILSHEDNLISVYANLDEESLTLNDENEKTVDTGTILGQTGNSAWQKDKSNLEFQIIDTKDKSAINPLVLMPRVEETLKLSLTGIYLENKNHQFFDINTQKSFTSGLYRIYQKRNEILVPYKTSVSINGIVLDRLSYDSIIQENQKICINGKKKYTSSDVYPDDDLQLLGEAMFSPGKATLGLAVTDILGNVTRLNYSINIQ